LFDCLGEGEPDRPREFGRQVAHGHSVTPPAVDRQPCLVKTVEAAALDLTLSLGRRGHQWTNNKVVKVADGASVNMD
jgi:hypothetical protein